jgi:hypothetical protein
MATGMLSIIKTQHMEETLDIAFIADPDADEELSTGGPEAIADEDIKGSRLLLTKRMVSPIDYNGVQGGVLQLACTFQPAGSSRFAAAQVKLRLKTPAETKIVDLAPRSIDDAEPVEITLNKKGQLGLKTFALEPAGEVGSAKKYVKYHCKVQGSGEGSALARWDFRENPDKKDGIGPEQVITITLPVTGNITAELIVSARLVKGGIGGQLEKIRDLILGVQPGERAYPIQFDIPAKNNDKHLLNSFFKLFTD